MLFDALQTSPEDTAPPAVNRRELLGYSSAFAAGAVATLFAVTKVCVPGIGNAEHVDADVLSFALVGLHEKFTDIVDNKNKLHTHVRLEQLNNLQRKIEEMIQQHPAIKANPALQKR